MGGHLALRAVAERVLHPLPTALVLSAPMLDVLPETWPLALRLGAARAMCVVGDARRPAWKWNERPGILPGFRQALLTHDAARYADELWWRDARPELAVGPGSWGWVRGALASIRMLAAPGVLEAVDLPIFIIATRADRLVGARAIERAAARLPQAQILWFGTEAGHEILREVDPVRDQALVAINGFLESVS
jgi:lysophospholipase